MTLCLQEHGMSKQFMAKLKRKCTQANGVNKQLIQTEMNGSMK